MTTTLNTIKCTSTKYLYKNP